MSNITSIIQDCINPEFTLKRERESWVITEENPNATNKKLLVNGNGIFGFSLDSKPEEKPVWKFIKNNALKGMCSVCDGIFVTTYKNIDYFIIIDLKSMNTNGAKKQIITGIHLCEWIYSVLKLHGHLNKDAKFIGVISKLSRRQQTSKKSSIRTPLPPPENYNGFPIFSLENYNRLSINDICKEIENQR